MAIDQYSPVRHPYFGRGRKPAILSFPKIKAPVLFGEGRHILLQKTVKHSKIRHLNVSMKKPKVFSPISVKKWGKSSKAPARLPYKITHIVFPQAVDI
jgi:hypothetical protein